jgi:hypothetical protein
MANKSSNIPFNDSANLNTLVFQDYLQRLKSLAITVFEWQGLPETIPGKFIENTLYNLGKIAFFKDPSFGLMAAKTNVAGKLNFYDQPVKWQMYATGYNKQFDADDCVIIHNNYQSLPTSETIKLFAYRLYECERTLDVNIKNQKYPLVIKGTKDQVMSLQNIYFKVDGNQPVVFIDKNLDPNAFSVFKTDMPYLADRIMLYKHDVWNEAMTFLGIANANTDKKERLITDEVQANDQLVQLGAQVMLAARQDAAEQINKMFNLNVNVVQRKIVIDDVADPDTDPEKAGDMNG